MTEPQTTLITVFHNGVHALKLMWKSFCSANPEPVLFWCYDNASSDGSEDYAKLVSNYTLRHWGNSGHAAGLDALCAKVRTPYTLIADVDVEFVKPTVSRMLHELKSDPSAFCVAYPSHNEECVIVNNHFGKDLVGQKRINPCCALFDTLKLQQLLKHFSFGVYAGPWKFYDVGAMLHTVSLSQGLSVVEPEWVREAVLHYGNIGCYVCGAYTEDNPLYVRAKQMYSIIEQRAATYIEPSRKVNEPVFELIT